ncbi:MAG: hypothetical protein PWQ96_307 [Clostridia bacterium]|jgi:predicted nucleotide-binding protein (sugar kinase/HSP70/actin superfamily)|nr:hypothetical protein [Clostridia bacterium]
MKVVGIPRSLFYYYQYPLWSTFLRFLDFEVVVSSQTNKKIVDEGLRHTVEEVCLPIKVFFGHITELKDRVDYVFTPRIISTQPKTYICPKFMGLPDMVKADNILPEDRLLSPTINLRMGTENYMKQFNNLGRYLGKSQKSIRNAWNEAIKIQNLFENLCKDGFLPDEAIEKIENRSNVLPNKKGSSIAVLGHGYNIYDNYTSMGLIKKISKRYRVVTADMLSESIIQKNVAHLPKRMFWSLGQKMFGGTNFYLNDESVKGIIYLCSFGCGPDSLVGDLVERNIHRQEKKPFMLLTIDEHTDEAGIQTRLEAFLDMIDRREVV